MKTLILVLLLSSTVHANQLAVLLGASTDAIQIENYNNSTGVKYNSEFSQTTTDVGLDYAFQVTPILFVDQNLTINSKQIANGHLRYDPSLSISLAENLNFKVGPSILYNYTNSSQLDRIGYGYGLATEYSFNQNIYLSAGYFTSRFVGAFGGSEQTIKTNSIKLRLGYAF